MKNKYDIPYARNPFAPGSQLHALLEFFYANPLIWIAMPTLAAACHSYVVHSRVSDIRKVPGLADIRNHVVNVRRGRNRATYSYYIYVPPGCECPPPPTRHEIESR